MDRNLIGHRDGDSHPVGDQGIGWGRNKIDACKFQLVRLYDCGRGAVGGRREARVANGQKADRAEREKENREQISIGQEARKGDRFRCRPQTVCGDRMEVGVGRGGDRF